jgi:hypothetical protein
MRPCIPPTIESLLCLSRTRLAPLCFLGKGQDPGRATAWLFSDLVARQNEPCSPDSARENPDGIKMKQRLQMRGFGGVNL